MESRKGGPPPEQDVHQDQIFEAPLSRNVGPLAILEFQEAVRAMKNNKATGPNGTPAELHKWLEGEALEKMVSLTNRTWQGKLPTKDMQLADTALIYNKRFDGTARELQADRFAEHNI